MKQVNLKEILLNAFIQYKADYPENRLSKVYTIEQFQNATEILTVGMNAMQEACNQTVDLCAENATLNELRNGEWVASYIIYNTPQGKIEVNEQSILDTKKQII